MAWEGPGRAHPSDQVTVCPPLEGGLGPTCPGGAAALVWCICVRTFLSSGRWAGPDLCHESLVRCPLPARAGRGTPCQSRRRMSCREDTAGSSGHKALPVAGGCHSPGQQQGQGLLQEGPLSFATSRCACLSLGFAACTPCLGGAFVFCPPLSSGARDISQGCGQSRESQRPPKPGPRGQLVPRGPSGESQASPHPVEGKWSHRAGGSGEDPAS